MPLVSGCHFSISNEELASKLEYIINGLRSNKMYVQAASFGTNFSMTEFAENVVTFKYVEGPVVAP